MTPENERRIISDKLNRHFYWSFEFINQMRTQWPQHLDFICQCVDRYALNIVSPLLETVSDQILDIQPGMGSQDHSADITAYNSGVDACERVASEQTLNFEYSNIAGTQHESISLATGACLDPFVPTSFNSNAAPINYSTSAPDLQHRSSESNTAIGYTYGTSGTAMHAVNAIPNRKRDSKKRKRQHCTMRSLRFQMFDRTFWIALHSLIRSLLTTNETQTSCDLQSVSSIYNGIEELERKHQSCALRRRILLHHFAAHREQVIRDLRDLRSEPGIAIPRETGKIESEALDILLTEIFPHTADTKEIWGLKAWREKYEDDRKKIKNRYQKSRNWWKAVQKFSIGILVVIPHDGDPQWQDYKFEKLKDAQCDALLTNWQIENRTALTMAATKLNSLARFLCTEHERLQTLRIPLHLIDIPQHIDEEVVIRLLEQC